MAEMDRHIDEQLRGVPLPSGLMSRLRDACCSSGDDAADRQLDARLKDVALPETLVEVLSRVPDDAALDENILAVRIPRRMVARLKTIAYEVPYRRMKRLAMAASLFLMLSGLFWLYMMGIFSSVRSAEPHKIVTLYVPYDGPPKVTADLQNDPPEALRLEVAPRPMHTELAAAEPRVELFQPLEPASGPAGELWSEMDAGLDLWEDIFLTRYGPIGAPHQADDALPELEPPPLPRGGVALPLVRQFHRRFFLVHGVHPPIFPDAHVSLQSMSVPLTTGTESFARTKQLVTEGRLPEADEIRVEDFLAAVDYPFAHVSDGEIGLRVSAGPSVFRRELNPQLTREFGWQPGPAGLLQVGVKVGRVPRSGGAGTHLTVAVDASASMRWGSRMPMVRQSLRQLLSQLGARDRLSLIVFNERVLHRVDNIHEDHSEHVLDVIDGLRASGGTNLAGALQQALSLATDNVVDSGLTRRLVLVTDGNTKIEADAGRKLHDLMGLAAEQGLGFSVLQLSEDDAADAVLDKLAAAAHGWITRIEDGTQLRRSLIESLSGRSSRIARDAKLVVHFRPESVAAYRLLGHESTGLGGLLPAAAEAELHAGDAATALFEVWLKPGGENIVGEAVLTWFDLETGMTRHESFTITRLQFATSFAESSLSLQQATLVAEAAEVLRESPFVNQKSRNLQGVLELANQVSPRLAERRDFQRFITFLRDLERVRVQHQGG